MRRALLIVILGLLTACAQHGGSPGQPGPATIPTDGVHLEGAIQAVYPVGSGATCNLATVNADKVLQFSPNVRSGAVIGLEIIKYTGPATYAEVGWPPYDRSAFWVGVIGGKTWRAESGVITVTSDATGRVSGTVRASGMREVVSSSGLRTVFGTTTVNASGSWSCQMLP